MEGLGPYERKSEMLAQLDMCVRPGHLRKGSPSIDTKAAAAEAGNTRRIGAVRKRTRPARGAAEE